MINLIPVISEKSISGADRSVYTFKVPKSANKLTIQAAVKQQFSVNPVRVAVSTVPAKQRRRGRLIGVRPGYKKAMVTLKKGEKITELEG